MSYHYLTQEGLDKLKNELEDLKYNGRQEAAKAIAEARDKGDLSENAEYDAAKNAQGMLELRINELEKIYSNSRIIDETLLDKTKVTLLSKVKIRNIKTKKDFIYTLVSETEANLKDNKISTNSPIGKGLLGLKPGGIAKIHTPAGVLEFEVIELMD